MIEKSKYSQEDFQRQLFTELKSMKCHLPAAPRGQRVRVRAGGVRGGDAGVRQWGGDGGETGAPG